MMDCLLRSPRRAATTPRVMRASASRIGARSVPSKSDTVVTFGADGGYGHPDHVAISELTTEAFRALAGDRNRGR